MMAQMVLSFVTALNFARETGVAFSRMAKAFTICEGT